MKDGLTRLLVWATVLLVPAPLVFARAVDAEVDDPAALQAPLGDQEAKQLAEQALSAYEEHRYQDAARLYLRAHVLRPDPTLLYNVARCHEHLGQAPAALEFYRRFTSTADAEPALRARALARVAALQGRGDPRRRRGLDLRLLVPGVLLCAGGLGGVTAGAVFDGTTASRDEILATSGEFDKRDAIAAARARGIQAAVAYGIGGAALLSGVVLVSAAVARRQRAPAEPRISAGALLLPAGGVLVLGGRLW